MGEKKMSDEDMYRYMSLNIFRFFKAVILRYPSSLRFTGEKKIAHKQQYLIKGGGEGKIFITGKSAFVLRTSLKIFPIFF